MGSSIPSIINCKETATADVVFLGIPFDHSSGLAGADQGPRAIRQMLDSQIELYEPITETSPAEHLRIAYCDLSLVRAGDAGLMVQVIHGTRRQLATQNPQPFIIGLGGDHSVSIGIFEDIAREYRSKTLPNILHIDAHFDLRDSDADFRENPIGRYAHCSVMRRAAELGFRIVSVGIRSYSKEEALYALKEHEEQFRPFFWNLVRPGYEPAESTIVNELVTHDVYLTIDVDGIEPAYMPATGTPVQNGLTWAYTMRLLQQLFNNRNVIGMDITEVAPPLAPTDLTAYGAATLAYTAIAFKFRDRLEAAERK